jgi:hypothetical protein
MLTHVGFSASPYIASTDGTVMIFCRVHGPCKSDGDYYKDAEWFVFHHAGIGSRSFAHFLPVFCVGANPSSRPDKANTNRLAKVIGFLVSLPYSLHNSLPTSVS